MAVLRALLNNAIRLAVIEGRMVSAATHRRNSVARVEPGTLAADSPAQRVGGRRGPVDIPTGRGGYPCTCGGSNFEVPAPQKKFADARIDELRVMGLQLYWIHVAEVFGFERFLMLWRIFDAEPSLRTNKGDLLIGMRPFRSYLRFQRNRTIETMAGAGMTVKEIQQHLRLVLCEKISRRHILRIATGR